MDLAVAAEHAQAVCREAVSAGLTDKDTARKLYQDYTTYLRRGARGTFTQLLLSRRVVDQQGYQYLEEKVPPGAAGGGSQTGTFSAYTTGAHKVGGAPTSGSYPAVAAATGTHAALAPSGTHSTLPAQEELVVERTMEFDNVLAPKPAAAPALAAAPPPAPGGLDLAADADEQQESAFFSDGSDDDSPMREPKPGEVLGEYELLSVLGRGGMGVIYKAKHTGNGKEFALKTLISPQGWDDDNMDRERFQKEVEALRRLEHPNIVGVHQCGRQGSIDWYVMDYVKGKELKDLMKEGKLTNWEKLEIFEDLCRAIQHAHERGVVHRDLKPANVIIDSEGDVKVLDFGLAKFADDELSLTRTGAAMGTPYYMSPEQVLNPKEVDHRADIYALGAMLYEMMTGNPPFIGETFGEISNKIMNDEPEPPSRVNPNVHLGIDAICLKALEKEPDRRYQEVETMRIQAGKYRRGTRGASSLTLYKNDLRRFLEKNKKGVIAGIVIASIFYLPILFVMALF